MFCIVQTKERGKPRLAIVPSGWVDGTTLYWPSKQALSRPGCPTQKDRNSNYEPDWMSLPCKVKRKNFYLFESAEKEMIEMATRSDSSDAEAINPKLAQRHKKIPVVKKQGLKKENFQALIDEKKTESEIFVNKGEQENKYKLPFSNVHKVSSSKAEPTTTQRTIQKVNNNNYLSIKDQIKKNASLNSNHTLVKQSEQVQSMDDFQKISKMQKNPEDKKALSSLTWLMCDESVQDQLKDDYGKITKKQKVTEDKNTLPNNTWVMQCEQAQSMDDFQIISKMQKNPEDVKVLSSKTWVMCDESAQDQLKDNYGKITKKQKVTEDKNTLPNKTLVMQCEQAQSMDGVVCETVPNVMLDVLDEDTSFRQLQMILEEPFNLPTQFDDNPKNPAEDQVAESSKEENVHLDIPNTLKAILTNQINLAKSVAELSTKFALFLDSQSENRLRNRETKERPTSRGLFGLPINTKEKLEEMNLKLLNQEFFDELVAAKVTVCGESGKKAGKNCAYLLIDQLLERNLLTQFSWSGGSRDENKKGAFKVYKNIINLIFTLVNKADRDFSEEDCVNFLKGILKNANKRAKITTCVRTSSSKNRPKNLNYKKNIKSSNDNNDEVRNDQFVVEDDENDSNDSSLTNDEDKSNNDDDQMLPEQFLAVEYNVDPVKASNWKDVLKENDAF